MSRRYWLPLIAVVGLILGGQVHAQAVGNGGGSKPSATKSQAQPKPDAPPPIPVAVQNDIHSIASALKTANDRQPSSTEERNAKAQEDVAWWTPFLIGLASAELLITGGGVWLVYLTFRESRAAARAARDSADIANRALVAVERPILLVTMPEEFTFAEPLVDTGQPKFAISVENIGKQVATIQLANGYFKVQASSTPPPLTMRQPEDGGSCPIFFVGEVVVRPNAPPVGFWGERSAPLAPEETKALNDGSAVGFFTAGIIYADPLGVLRTALFMFLARPPFGSGQFVQLQSEDHTLIHATPGKQKAANEKLRASMVQLQRDHTSGKIK